MHQINGALHFPWNIHIAPEEAPSGLFINNGRQTVIVCYIYVYTTQRMNRINVMRMKIRFFSHYDKKFITRVCMRNDLLH